jgi:ATP-dependent Lon protease
MNSPNPAKPAKVAAPRVAPSPLPPERLRWRCDMGALRFTTTADVEPVGGVIGQDAAVEALRFGLETRAPGQNVFVRGLVGTGRLTLVRQLMEEMRTVCPSSDDRCYVHNFMEPERPRLIVLPPGKGHAFRRRMDRFADFIRDELRKALESETVRASRAALEQHTQNRISQITQPFEQRLRGAGLGLTTVQLGPFARPVIVPVVLGGQPVTPETFEHARITGQIPPQELHRIQQQREAFEGDLEQVIEQVQEIRGDHEEEVRKLYQTHARALLDAFVRGIRAEFPQTAVQRFLDEAVRDVLENWLTETEAPADYTRLYRVNVVLAHEEEAPSCPIIVETAPTMKNLLGSIELQPGPDGRTRASHLSIRAGSLLRADGGYLILEARDALSEPGAWKVLLRTLKTGRLEINPPEMGIFPWPWVAITPEPIDVSVKVILIGDHEVFAVLDEFDPDFPHLFKVLVDFDSTIPRDERGIALYAGVLARIAREEGLLPFDRSAVGALAEHGARIAAWSGKLTSRFGRLADIAREAAFIAGGAGRQSVAAADVHEAVRRSKARADLPSRQFREAVAEGRIRIQVSGAAVGQINGLAVLHAGPLTYGFPARITATIGPGTAGLINIEREAALSGAIHTKGFYILGGVLRTLLRTDHPLAFNASIAFEQSYGGIDGDSASGAEVCCLLSALTEVPLRQDLAMTGAIDQHGSILAVGGANEKIEGFFDTCRDKGLTGTQGVIIPLANAGDLMLRDEVVEAAREGRFHVYVVSTVTEALEILTGLPAGTRDESGRYPAGSLLALAMERSYEYWRRAARPEPRKPES